MNYNRDNFNGEFLPFIDTNFKIPLKNDNHKHLADASAAGELLFSSPLATVCHEEPAPPGAENYAQYTANNQSISQTSSNPFNPKKQVDLKRSALDAEFVQSKTGLPPELTKLLQPLYCELCGAKMNSPISAKTHYESKQHDKKVNAWLQDWSKETGEPIPKREKPKEGPVGPNAFHCDVCDLALTSLQHANQHYMGKKHRLTLAGRSNPSGSGYYGEDGKWIRINTKPIADPSGRFHIGASFKQQATTKIDAPTTTINSAATITPNTNATTINQNASIIESKSPITPINFDPEKYCKICDISVTSAPQMKSHLIGSKHTKKLKLLGEPPVASKNDTILNSLETDDPFVVSLSDFQSSSGHNNKRDNSIYRTPSGSYYCKPCDVTITTEVVFNQHLDSKKHIKTMKQSSLIGR